MTQSSINHKSVRLLFLVLGVISLIFILFFWGIYQLQLRGERSKAASTVNQLLQASLENAMLKRDLAGLDGIVKRLGEQEEILDVTILNPKGQVRFTGADLTVGQLYEQPVPLLCDGCEGDFKAATESTHFLSRADGSRVLRSVNPVKNKVACKECHGSVEDNAVNGILIVDYNAEPIYKKARNSILWLSLTGLVVLITTVLILWRFMRRNVLMPVAHLHDMSRELSQGNLKARAQIKSDDEFEMLGDSFNTMAERLDNSLNQLLDSEAYLQALIDAVPDGIRVIDSDFKVVHSNKAYQTQLGISDQGEVQPLCYRSSHQKRKPCPPTLMTCPLHEIQLKPEPVKTMQLFKRADGSEFEVQVFAAPLIIGQDEKLLMVESIRNLAEDIRFSHEQKLSAVGQLATGVAHEIHNPLSSIRMALKSALSKLESDSERNAEISKYLKLVDGEIDKCIDVTKRLLKLSSFGGEKMQLVDINIAVEETLSLLKYEAEQKNIQVELDLSKVPPRMLAANQDIRMLVLNLAQNAFHSMPDGGKLSIATSVKKDEMCLRVCDTGVGIKPEHKAHIFDPFFSYRADSDHGTGLGLTICQSIVQRYNGLIEAENVIPHGTCFTVRLQCPECLFEV